MIRAFAVYCAMGVSSLAIANHQGYVFSTYFSGTAKADKTANGYHK
jgi:F0F1-type ATP synthase membrane subunit c/vacuolar-type H+-ATPase subunit K